jgi:hypothetical protein
MLISLAVFALAASSAFAGSYDFDREQVTVTATSTNAATAVTETISNVRGEVREIFIDLATATTATVTVAVSPEDATMTGYNIYTGALITADVILRPGFDMTDDAGAALTGDNPVFPVLCGDDITVTVSNFDATNKTVKATVKYRK